MKKFLFLLIFSALFMLSFSFSAQAYVVYVKSDLENSANLGIISKDSSGNITDTIIRSDLAPDSEVFSFKHNGQDRILISENNDENGTNIISVYNPADLSKVLASADIYSTNLTLVDSVAELGNNLILAGDGNKSIGKGAIVEINPETCAIVGTPYTFGSMLNLGGVYSAGDISSYAIVVTNAGKIYARFSQVNSAGSSWIYFPVEADSLSSLPSTLPYITTDFPYNYVMRSINNNLYMSVNTTDDSGFYKVNSLTDTQKIIDDMTWHFDSDGSNGFYLSKFFCYPNENSGYVRYLTHWNGSTLSEIYDVGEFDSNKAAHSVLGFVKYDSSLNTVFITKETYAAATDDILSYSTRLEGINLLAISPSNGNLLKEISGGTITSFAVVEGSSSSASQNPSETTTPTTSITQSTFSEISSSAKEKFSTDYAINKIKAKLGSLLSSFPVNTTGTTSTGATENVTNAQLKSALGSNTGNSAMIFPTQSVTVAGTYPLGAVSLNGYKAGAKIALYMLVKTTSGFSLADLNSANVEVAETVSNATFFMADGEIISEVPEDSNTEVIAFSPMEAGKEYTPVVISTTETGSLGSSGSGCNIAIGAAAFVALALAFFKKH